MIMATPAWIQEVSTDTANMSEKDAANAQAMGLGYRFEHHFRAQGTSKSMARNKTSKASAHAFIVKAFDGSTASSVIAGSRRCFLMDARSVAWRIRR